MTYLLDTHYMIWAIADTKKLSKTVKDIITNPENKIIVSVISFWEVSLKSSLGKLDVPVFPLKIFRALVYKLGLRLKALRQKLVALIGPNCRSWGFHCLPCPAEIRIRMMMMKLSKWFLGKVYP